MAESFVEVRNPDVGNYQVETDALANGHHVQLHALDIGDGTTRSKVRASNPLPVTNQNKTSTGNAPSFATVGTSSASAVPSNANRKGLILVNDSSNVIYLAFGAAAVVGSGIRLNASGGSFSMNEFNFTTQQIFAIAMGAGSNLTIQEFE